MDDVEEIMEPTLWKKNGWIARIIRSDDDGWAVEMTRIGDSEPSLVGPWTMGRDKKNPKPLDTAAFNVLVKTAAEVIRRHEQALHAQHHKNVGITVGGARLLVTLDIVPDEDDPHAVLAAQDAYGESLAKVRVKPTFKLTTGSAQAWAEDEFRKPG